MDGGAQTMRKLKQFNIEVPEDRYVSTGHRACAGCGGVLALHLVLKVLGKQVVVVTCPGCMGTALGISIQLASTHSPFASVASWASGVKAGLEMQGDKETIVLGWAGDGGTMDIGLQALSAAAERNEDIIFVCYDNEAYMNTGVQRSSATPLGAWTMTTPIPRPKWEYKKNIMEIMAAHRIPYAATTTIAHPQDLVYKVSKAKEIKGMRFINILAPCPTGWRFAPNLTVEVARRAVDSKVFPLYEVEDRLRYNLQQPQHEIPVRDYLKIQGRFSHLGDDAIDTIQRNVDQEWEYLLAKCTR